MKSIKNLLLNPLMSGSAIMIIGSNLANFFNYIYHFIMGRLLGPAHYGELAALFSLVALIGMIPNSFGLVIVKQVSSAKNKQEVSNFINWFNIRIIISSLVLFFILLLFTPIIGSFLKIENKLYIVAVSALFIFGLSALFYKSVLQGLLSFRNMVLTSLVEILIKVILGTILVYLGFSVGGALVGLVVSGIFGWLIARFFIKDYLNERLKNIPDLRSIFLFSIPVLIQSVSLTSLFSTDLVLVKHFFSSYDTGIYASLSSLGRIIFFGAGPIGAVMFPLVAKKQSMKEDYNRIFLYSFLLTGALAVVVLFFYWLLPEVAIRMLYGKLYIEGASLLVLFAIFMSLYTLGSLVISFQLSINNTSVVILPALAAMLQFAGIWFFHNSLYQVIMVSIVISALLLLMLFVYFAYVKSKTDVSYSAFLQAGKNNSQRPKKN